MASRVEASTDETQRLDDPAFYAEDPHPVFERLRRETPVLWHRSTGFWAVSRYRDIQHVFRHPEVFSSERGVFITDRKFGRANPFEFAAAASVLPAGGANILETDPPWHTEYRKAVLGSRAFSRGYAVALEDPIRRIVATVFDRVAPGAVVNADDLALDIATRVAAEFLGLPEEDVPTLRNWTSTFVEATDSTDPAMLERGAEVSVAMWRYLESAISTAPAPAPPGALFALAEASRRAAAIDPDSLLKFACDLLIAGTVNNRSSMDGAVVALCGFPGERARLLADPALLPTATEEVVRWVTPAPHICRTALTDTQIGGTPVAEGDYVVLLLASGNRDGEAWERPDVFDVARPPEPSNLSFGHGIHLCLGAPLARLEIRVFLEELLRRAPAFELAGDVVRQPSTMVNSFREVPVRFVR